MDPRRCRLGLRQHRRGAQDGGLRSRDLALPRRVVYQTEVHPGCEGRPRTANLPGNSRLLRQLSYLAKMSRGVDCSSTPATWRARGGTNACWACSGDARTRTPNGRTRTCSVAVYITSHQARVAGETLSHARCGAFACREPAVSMELTAAYRVMIPDPRGLCPAGLWALPPAWRERSRISLGGQDSNLDCEGQSLECCPLHHSRLGVRAVGSTAGCRRGNDRARTADLLLAKQALLPTEPHSLAVVKVSSVRGAAQAVVKLVRFESTYLSDVVGALASLSYSLRCSHAVSRAVQPSRVSFPVASTRVARI